MQYSLPYRAAYNTAEDNKISILLNEILPRRFFYRIICDAEGKHPMDYFEIKDTSAAIWEIVIELDRKYMHKCFGSKNLRLYLALCKIIKNRLLIGFDSDYLYCFHYSDSMGYLVFCCHNVATKHKFILSTNI